MRAPQSPAPIALPALRKAYRGHLALEAEKLIEAQRLIDRLRNDREMAEFLDVSLAVFRRGVKADPSVVTACTVMIPRGPGRPGVRRWRPWLVVEHWAPSRKAPRKPTRTEGAS